MIDATEVWNLTLSPVLVWLQEIFNYRFLARESIRRNWSLMVLVSSFQFRILCDLMHWDQTGVSGSLPWGNPGWRILSFPAVCLEAVRLPRTLWVLCLCSLCPMNSSSAGHTGYPRALQLHLNYNYTALPLKGSGRAWLCCCTWLHFQQIHGLFVLGCKALHSINALGCSKLSLKTFSSQIHTLAEKITVTYFTGLLTCRLDQTWLPEVESQNKSRDSQFYYIIKKNLDSPLAGTGGWRLTDKNKIARNKFYVAIFFLPQMWMLMQNTLL